MFCVTPPLMLGLTYTIACPALACPPAVKLKTEEFRIIPSINIVTKASVSTLAVAIPIHIIVEVELALAL